MKAVANQVTAFSQADIGKLESEGRYTITYGDGESIALTLEDVEITSDDIPGWAVASDGKLTVALDLTLTPELEQEGVAREFVNHIQNVRKDEGLEVTDHIHLQIEASDERVAALEAYKDYICKEVLAETLNLGGISNGAHDREIDGEDAKIAIQKV